MLPTRNSAIQTVLNRVSSPVPSTLLRLALNTISIVCSAELLPAYKC